MLKKTKIWLSMILIFGTAVIVAAMIIRQGIPDAGLAEAHTSDVLETMTVTPDYAWGMNAEDLAMFEDFKANMDKTVSDIVSTPIVITATADGTIDQSIGSIGQEVVVSEVKKGGNVLKPGEKIFVYQYFGFTADAGEIHYVEPLNIMKKGETYLIFLDEVKWDVQNRLKSYIAQDTLFPYINIKGNDTKTLPRDLTSCPFSELEDYEFFSVSEDITDILNQMKKEILEQYRMI